jgi:hypothetical protein
VTFKSKKVFVGNLYRGTGAESFRAFLGQNVRPVKIGGVNERKERSGGWGRSDYGGVGRKGRRC